jgi:dipeptide/tripeptide permease
MAQARSPFPPVFWVANLIEVLERFAYYGIYMGFGIYMAQLGFTRADLGIVQTIFLGVSYLIPLFSGTLADRYGFKPVLIVSYLAYLPAILLLVYTKTFSGIVLTMLTIGFAAGIFKPLISGTVRATTDASNKTLGFGIFYAMVNVGGSFGPLVAGKLRAISWDYAFYAAAIAIGLMFVITLLFYKEPPREREGVTLGQKFREMGQALADVRFSVFLVLLGVLFWLPFWVFFNVGGAYVDQHLDTARLYQGMRSLPLIGPWLADFLSHEDDQGVRRIIGETISHTGYIIMVLQLFVSTFIERFRAMPAFMGGLAIAALGFVVLALAISTPSLVFVGIFLFAIGEMIASPRIQEYITWIAPKEKAGIYMGTNFLAVCIGAMLSGVTYTPLFGHYEAAGHPERIWYVLAVHLGLSIITLWGYLKVFGEFQELEA